MKYQLNHFGLPQHVLDQYITYKTKEKEYRRWIESYNKSLNGDIEALSELMDEVYIQGYNEGVNEGDESL